MISPVKNVNTTDDLRSVLIWFNINNSTLSYFSFTQFSSFDIMWEGMTLHIALKNSVSVAATLFTSHRAICCILSMCKLMSCDLPSVSDDMLMTHSCLKSRFAAHDRVNYSEVDD